MARPWTFLLCLLLAACAGEPNRAPVENRHGEKKTVTTPDRYAVRRGDTLYSIAWRYNLDHRALARLNGIPSPYTIYPGQQLKLRGKPPSSPPTPVATTRAPAAKAPAATASRPVTKTSSPRVTSSSPAEFDRKVDAWHWPTRGTVVRKFSATTHKGIDIDGKAGDAVLATAGGSVVYAGSGIVGYGNLLIVKHSQDYLSAYGHNRRLLVKEGDRVKAGQKIAEKGSSATNTVKLHFEIRRDGKPVDPLKLLPKRG
ncbi:MAG: peptidoglycan DD-metalloendopeptidase family protein [Halieaceae bacterium]|nr:peptidoglycan DD-metalloendopeptidase family protein [Halieaceae bacterium]